MNGKTFDHLSENYYRCLKGTDVQARYHLEPSLPSGAEIKACKYGVCDQAYPELNGYKIHIKTHDQKQLQNPKCEDTSLERSALKCPRKTHLQCEKCNQCFVSESDLLSHKKLGVGIKSCEHRIRCESYVCTTFNTEYDLRTEKIHNRVEHDKPENHNQIRAGAGQTNNDAESFVPAKLLQCTKCCQSFPDSNSLETYKIINLFCEICNRSFHDKRELDCHEKVHSAVINSHCDICNMTSTCKCHFTDHEKNAVSSNRKSTNLEIPSNKKFVCEICEKTCITAASLIRHVKVHEDQEFECVLCKKLFSLKSDLLQHNVSVHTQSNKNVYQCTVCRKIYFNPCFLQRHIATHFPVKQEYPCELCGRLFLQKDTLKKHVRIIHCNIKPLRCNICNRRYITERGLSDHMERHNNNGTQIGRKKCLCDICGKYMSSSSSLERHKRGHTGEKPFQCEICNTFFIATNSLRRHRLSHTNEKPYECDFCEKRFSMNYNMLVHRRIHTGEKPFKCETCGECFRVKCILEAHIKSKHN